MTKKFLLRAIPHAVAVLVFVIVSCAYFSLVWEGYDLRQGDIDHWRGMSQETVDHRILYDEEPLWTNSMFSGMPGYQISVEHEANLLRPVLLALRLGLPGPVGTLFLAMLSFYVLALCLRIKPWIGIGGAVAFGLSTFTILYLGAGHTAKVTAVALMPAVIGGLILAFRGNIIGGSALFMFALGLQISANHLQMTYYLALLCGAIVIAESVRMLMRREAGKWLRTGLALGAAAFIAVLPGMSNLLTTYEYSKYTTRGSSELTITAEGEDKSDSEKKGLEKTYMLEYNFGPGEAWSLVIPNARGGASGRISDHPDALQKVNRDLRKAIGQNNIYWGEQRFSGGAFYFGAGIMVLFILGLVFTRESLKWPFAVITVLALALSSKAEGGLNDLFIDHFPMYNKFRDTKMILVLLQVMAPAMAIIFLEQLIEDRLRIRERKWLFLAAGIVIAVFIAITAKPTITGEFLTLDEIDQFDDLLATGDGEQVAQVEAYRDGLITARSQAFTQDATRSLLLVLLFLGLAVAAHTRKIGSVVVGALLTLFVAGDLWSVDRRYVNADPLTDENGRPVKDEQRRPVYRDYVLRSEKNVPEVPVESDEAIFGLEKDRARDYDANYTKLKQGLSDEFDGVAAERIDHLARFGALNFGSHYRVLDPKDPFNDARTSFFHKSIGGYHGAKLKRYQEMIEFHIGPAVADIRNRANEVIGVLRGAQSDPPKDALSAAALNAQIDSLQSDFMANCFRNGALNMLNTRYIINPMSGQPMENPNACGAAWFVNKLHVVPSADEEITQLGRIVVATDAVVDQRYASLLQEPASADSMWSIQMTHYQPNLLRYSTRTSVDAPAVFSEIHYPEGWICRIDGKETEYARVNYILRAVMVPAGEHTVEWSFEPAVFRLGSTVSLMGSVLLLLLALGGSAWSIRRKALPPAEE